MARDVKSVHHNKVELREEWLRAAVTIARPYFAETGYPLPDKIRVSIGFPSWGRKGKTVGETWHAPASADQSFEIFIRPDLAEPYEVMVALVRQLVHAALPVKEDQGKKYRTAAGVIGLTGRMRDAVPNPLLKQRLSEYVAELGEFPHASLDINWKSVDKPPKQTTRMLKAECPGEVVDGQHQPCGFTVRLAKKWFDDLGPPSCPRHGPMKVELTEAQIEAAELDEEITAPSAGAASFVEDRATGD